MFFVVRSCIVLQNPGRHRSDPSLVNHQPINLEMPSIAWIIMESVLNLIRLQILFSVLKYFKVVSSFINWIHGAHRINTQKRGLHEVQLNSFRFCFSTQEFTGVNLAKIQNKASLLLDQPIKNHLNRQTANQFTAKTSVFE